MRSLAKKFFMTLSAALLAANCYGEGLSSLAEVGKEQEQMARELTNETKAYEKIKNAIDKGSVELGQTREQITKCYGEPVVVIQEQGDYSERWVYKAGDATYFENKKIYLYFDKNGTLAKVNDLGST